MKNRMKYSPLIAAVAIAGATAALLAGCSGSAAGKSPTTEIRLSIPDPITSSVGMAATHFADQVKTKSAGKLKVTVIPNGTSFGGDQTAAVTRVEGGSLDAVILSTSVYAATDKKMNAISLPYLFTDTAQEVTYLKGAPG